MARIVPQLSARDVEAYIAFLADAFGFEVTSYWKDPSDPNHVNVEVELDGAVIGIGRRAPEQPPPVGVGLYVVLEEVDAHYARAKAAGATISYELGDQPWGHRMYGAVDPEGHEWAFASPIE